MRIMFMGTPDFAVPSLEALYKKHQVVCVVSQPDKPKGRGHNLMPTQTKLKAQELGIPVEQPVSLRDGAAQPILDQYRPEMIVVVAYGKILPQYILNYPKYGCINVHGSLLPKYRGAAPIQWAVLNGDAQSGVTIMQMDIGMDTGDMILQKSTPIGDRETSGELFDRLSILGAEALLEAIELIETEQAVLTPQNDLLATHAPMINKVMANVSFEMKAVEFLNKVRGFCPWPVAHVSFLDESVKIFKAAVGRPISEPCGTICAIDKEHGIEVVCADGNSVVLEQLQRPGKKITDGYSFAQGMRLKVGDIFK